MKNITFNNPYLLFIAIPLILFFVLTFIFVIKRKNIKKIISLVLHILISILIASTLAGLKSTIEIVDTNVYLLCDVSFSTNNVQEKMDDYIKEYYDNIPSNTKMGVICFARNQELLVKLGEDLKSVKENNCDLSSSNIEKALKYTISLFDDYHKKHIVLLSDGLEVDGNILSYCKELNDEIRIDAVYFDSSLNEEDYEMELEIVDGSKSTYLGVNEKLNVNIKSTFKDEVNLKIYCDDLLIKENKILVNKGINNYVFDTLTNVNGKHIYRIEIQNNNDYIKDNNRVFFIQEVIEKPNILYIYKEEPNSLNYISSFENKCNVSRVPETRLRETSISYLCKFDEVILNNVNLGNINNYENFVESLNIYVNEYGKTLITLGGENTYMSGGFYNSKMKDILPINISPNDTKNSIAVMLLIDCSDSMSGSSLASAKKGAIECLSLLSNDDYFGVVAFGTNTRVVWPLSKPTSQNRKIIEERINNIQNDGSTMMSMGLQEAYNQIRHCDILNKMVLVLSDGQPGDNGQVEICESMASKNIMVSTISIGHQINNLMEDMAHAGNGKCTYVNDSNAIASAMLNEVTEVIMEPNIERTINVKKSQANSIYLNGVNNLVSIEGINFSKNKFGATSILSTDITLLNGMEVNDVPILSSWDYGKGKVVSLMTDTTKKWTSSWNDESIDKLYYNLMFNSLPKEHTENNVIFTYEISGYTSYINVDFNSINVRDEVNFIITSPSGNIEKYNAMLSNGKYGCLIDIKEEGIYEIKIEKKNSINMSYVTYDFSLIKNYSKEYDAFMEADNLLLWQIVDGRGVLSNKVIDSISYEQANQTKVEHYDYIFMIVILILFVIDVMIRKFSIKDITKIKYLFRKK